MAGRSERQDCAEPPHGSGFQELGKRSNAFRESRELEQIRQLAANGDSGRAGDGEGSSSQRSSRENGDLSGWEDEEASRIPGETQQMASQQLHHYREQLAKDMQKREGSARTGQHVPPGQSRVLSFNEETKPSPFAEPSAASTDSGATVRGGTTPGMVPTPSYPFPRMVTPGTVHPSLHRPFTALSPTTPMSAPGYPGSFDGRESFMSAPSTASSAMTFMPPGVSQLEKPTDFPTPNLYQLTLMLSAEPGLDAWWGTVVQIMTEVYRADRVTLAVPADSTDVENIPWGLKATYNASQEEQDGRGCMPSHSSFLRSSAGDRSEMPAQGAENSTHVDRTRPGLPSRHSFTSYENRKEKTPEKVAPSTRRPANVARSKSSYPAPTATNGRAGDDDDDDDDENTGLNKKALEEHDALVSAHALSSWEASCADQREGRGKVLDVLQALDYEADPLLDHNGVSRVLERGKVIALTRNYPYHNQATGEGKLAEAKTTVQSKRVKVGGKRPLRSRAESLTAKLSTLLGGAKASPVTSRSGRVHGQDTKSSTRMDPEEHQPPSPDYQEFEQAPPSPWSQSPAPSPAVRAESNENPFFTAATVDEESFNPSPGVKDYSTLPQPETIGVDNSWTVLHIPLTHVLLSKPNPAFHLDTSVMEQKCMGRNKHDARSQTPKATSQTSETTVKDKHVPIAILSILSRVIPYPANLRHSLAHLAPHLATSFSLCRHYTSLQNEIKGLHKRRQSTALQTFLFAGDDRRDSGGSVTSASEFSGASRGAAASPAITPGWDLPAALSLTADRRVSVSSPAAESYFNIKSRSGSGTGEARPRQNSKDSSGPDRRLSLRIATTTRTMSDLTALLSHPRPEAQADGDTVQQRRSEDAQLETGQPKRGRESPYSLREERAGDGGRLVGSSGEQARPPGMHRHTQLHTHGANVASTFQSLVPPSSTIPNTQPQTPSSVLGSVSQREMTPSDSLKGLILDFLPAHVFVGLPQTGEIVWVNSRFLAYRGMSSGDVAVDPWGSIHPDDRDEYLRAWHHTVRTGEQFSRAVRIRRFDGQYRWFFARAVMARDKRNSVAQLLGSYMDIHDQHVAELKAARQEEIEVSEAKHRLLANLIPQIIFTATEGEGVTFANEQWLSYTGQGFEDTLGLGFMHFVHPDDLAKCQIPLLTPSPRESQARQDGQAPDSKVLMRARSENHSPASESSHASTAANLVNLARNGIIKIDRDSTGRRSYTTEIRLRCKTGQYRWHLIRCVEIDSINLVDGESSYFGSATDINDLKLMETKLKEAMESKGRFLSNMSHEIRTPLIGISGMVSFLQDTTLNEEQRDYTNTIQTSANSLLMIINDILDLSKVDAGMMKLNHEWFHTRSLIEDVNELVSTMAIAKRLELNYIVDEDVPAWIKGDRVRIRQVLLNVIGNAIKFTSQGEVFSRCQVVRPRGPGDNIMLQFSVVDTGRGFTEEESEMIFKPFSQIDGSSTRQHGGSGLGLVISRQLAELHGGKMEGSAEPGKGSTFTFTAEFGLPTSSDAPEPMLRVEDAPRAQGPLVQMAPRDKAVIADSPSGTDADTSSPAVASSGSSELSIQSARSQLSGRSSISSVNVGLVHFSEAARASGQDLTQMKFEMPQERRWPASGTTPTPDTAAGPGFDFRPPMYSILIICPQNHSREATTKHIETTLPKDIPHQITALATAAEAKHLIGGEQPVVFTHVVVNLHSPEEIIDLMDGIMKSPMAGRAKILVLSDSVQRQALAKLAVATGHENTLSGSSVTYIYKPVKPSRFAVIFDPAKENDLSIDRNRSTAQRLVESQRASYLEVERRIGNKGHVVLLVEDNLVNQKVLQKYLNKVGVAVDVAADGEECTEKVFAHHHGHYSLILCDLHMPRKDGYQACREIRAWEALGKYPATPIIALSANVMSDVHEKCAEAGFSDYVTKPVDIIALSSAFAKFF